MAIPVPLVGVILKKVSWTIKKQAHGQGLGRHTQEEVMAIGQADMKALSEFLGEMLLVPTASIYNMTDI